MSKFKVQKAFKTPCNVLYVRVSEKDAIKIKKLAKDENLSINELCKQMILYCLNNQEN